MAGTTAKNENTAAFNAYRAHRYTEALQLFQKTVEDLAANGKEDTEAYAEACYNLANCHYRLRNYAHSVLYYRRSLKADPANEDARFNLALSETKIEDRFVPPSEMFFVTWAKDLVYGRSPTAWGCYGLVALFFTLLFSAGYFILSRPVFRKIGFGAACLSLLFLVWCEIAALLSYHHVANKDAAVIMAETPTFESPTPTAKRLKTLHEGTTVTVSDRKTDRDGTWLRLILPDETEVWAYQVKVETV